MVILRWLLIVVLCVLLAGFGICGAYGTFAGLSGLAGGPGEFQSVIPLLIGCGLAGLFIAWLCWRGIVALSRARNAPDA